MEPTREATQQGTSETPQTPESPAPLIEAIPTGALQANCYLVTCPETGSTLIVDPGAEPERILRRVRERSLSVVSVVHTHGHFDHISATEAVLAGLEEPDAVLEGLAEPTPIAAHPADAYLYTREARATGAPFGYALPETLTLPDVALSDGDVLSVGELRLRVLATPGHTPGSISLLCDGRCVLTGDTLFRRGIGRTDLPGGDEDAIYESILTRLYVLTPALTVYPGHGPATTIAEERRENPFVQAP